MSNEERLILNNYLEDLYQAMQIGDIVFEPKHSSELYNLIDKLKKENKKYKEVINKAINYIDEYRDYQDVHKQVGIDKYEDVREDILFEENIEELLNILKEVEHGED